MVNAKDCKGDKRKMNLALELAEVEKQVSALISENIDLKKENAELKKLKRDCETSLCRAEYQYNYEQLTKATELLRKLVLEVTGYEEIYGYDTCEPVQEAEKFLSEVEK